MSNNFTKNVAVLVLIALLLILGLYTPWVPPPSSNPPPTTTSAALVVSQDLPKKQQEGDKTTVITTPGEDMAKAKTKPEEEKISTTSTTTGLGRSTLLTSPDQPEKATSSCKYLPDLLVGRCWGLTAINEKHFSWGSVTKRPIVSAVECEALCCEMGERCITYQWLNEKKMCHIGKHVRLGKEGGSVGEWCEPLPPAQWNGRKRILPVPPGTTTNTGMTERKREKKCEWGEPLPRQCWHLGPERMNTTNGRLGPRACAANCCANKHCIAWQQLPGENHFDHTLLQSLTLCRSHAK